MDEKKTILVTGCNGFIGSYFIKKYRNEYNIVGIDITNSDNEKGCVEEYIGDVCDISLIEKIFNEHKIDIVIHTAAEKSLIICETDKDKVYEVNYIATMNIAKISQRYNAKFIFISSDQVFDGKSSMSSEDSEVNPINYYGRLKVMVEKELINIYGSAICRTALVFGDIPEEQQEYFDSVKSSETLVVQGYVVQQTKYCLDKGLNIILPDDEFVSPTHVSLLADQLNSVIANDASGILHCCGNDRISRYEMGMIIAEHFGCQTDTIQAKGPENPLRPKDVSLDCSKTEEKLHMKFPDFKSMLNKYM